MHINVLGTEYTIRRLNESEYPKLKLLESNGLFEAYSKEIIINSEINKNTGSEYENIELYQNKVIRHEIIHAFFHESGLTDYCSDEKLVDFLALQFKKMYVAINYANVFE